MYYAATENIAIAIKKILIVRDRQDIVMPSGIPAAWLPEGITFTTSIAAPIHAYCVA